jgi:hypothetical protein
MEEPKEKIEEVEEAGKLELFKNKLKRIKWLKMEMIFFLILGLLLGVALKTEAVKKITIGFDDYKISSMKQGYDFAKLQGATEKENASEEAGSESDNGSTGNAASENQGSDANQANGNIQGN